MGTGSIGKGFCFALPPSLGWEPVKELARRFADLLYAAGFDTVVPARSYEGLEQSLLSGEVDAAWGPPIVSARVEAAGGKVALRAVRYGAVTYRSVLICRAHDDLDLRSLGQPGARKARAVWVDHWSMAGYILPRHHLRSRGVDLAEAFEDERTLGSYEACFRDLLEGDADLAASFANRRGLGYVEICGDEAFQLRTLGYTDECPNDAVVLSPALDEDKATELLLGLQRLTGDDGKKKILAAVFDVDDFDRPPADTYSPLLSLLD
jgi:ABC-type phosphate/phosphonate transport system substrate-binding protein